MPRPPRDRDTADRIFLLRTLANSVPATTIIAAMVAFYLRDRAALGRGAAFLLVLGGAALGVAIGFLAWWLSGRASQLFVQAVSGAGNLPPAPSFSLQESLVARGRIEEAVASYRELLDREPGNHDARMALATLLAGPGGDPAEAARLFREVRGSGRSPDDDYRASQALIDLYRATGDRGRLMAELARFADRYRGHPAGAAARRTLAELKADDPTRRP